MNEQDDLTGRFEQLLLRIIRQARPWADIRSTTATFLELGLDSANMTAAIHVISRGLGVRLSPTLLFECPNIESLTRNLLSAHLVRCEQMLSRADQAQDETRSR